MWTLLSHTRHKCWTIWLVISSLITLIVLTQTVNGTLNTVTSTAWIWLALTIMPGFSLLFISLIQHEQPAKLIPIYIHRALWVGTLGYLFLVMLTLLTQPVALDNGMSIQQMLILSYKWLVPFEAVLLIGFILAFFRQSSLYQPDNRAIVELALQHSSQWKAKGISRRQRCFDLIAADNLQDACNLIRSENDSLADVAISLQGRYTEVMNGMELHTVDPKDARRELNKIAVALLELGERF